MYPQVFFIKRNALTLARKLASEDIPESSHLHALLKAIRSLQSNFRVTLSVSQIACAYLLYRGYFAQLATGEGKSYSIALAAAWLSESGRSVHVLAPNDYLASRDHLHNQQFFQQIGITSACITDGTGTKERLRAYSSQVLYSTASCIAFDRMKEDFRHRGDQHYQEIAPQTNLILDEADAILIENGAVPFVASQYLASSKQEWSVFIDWAKSLQPEDYYYDTDTGSTQLADSGYKSLEDLCLCNGLIRKASDLYSSASSGFFHKGVIAIRAIHDMNLDEDYILRGREVKIINQSTGRVEADRQWGSGLHQAIEVKHSLEPSSEMDLRSKMTIPDLILLYKDFSGTSATIVHVEDEIHRRYGKLCIEVPRKRKDQRQLHRDCITSTIQEKKKRLISDVSMRHAKGQPVLIGVESISEAYEYGQMLSDHGIGHQTLTAHEEATEAVVIAQAGLPGRVTIATNMAGRGTDIRLGKGDLALEREVLNAGGLCVVGTSRQEERRLDEQLAGRTGRQGSRGEVQFYVSLEDKIFRDLKRLPRAKKMSSTFIRRSQSSCENKIAMSREEIDTLNSAMMTQTKIFLDIRDFWLIASDQDLVEESICIFSAKVRGMLWDFSVHKTGMYSDYSGFLEAAKSLSSTLATPLHELNKDYEGFELCAEAEKAVIRYMGQKAIGCDVAVLRSRILSTLDSLWSSHLLLLEQIFDHSKWQALIQKSEKIQFVIMAFDAFKSLVESIEQRIIECISIEVLNG